MRCSPRTPSPPPSPLSSTLSPHPPPPPPAQKARGKGDCEVALESVLRELREADKENSALKKTVARQERLICSFCDYVNT